MPTPIFFAIFPAPTSPLLAQGAAADPDYWLAIALLFVVLILGAVILYSVRRRMMSSEDSRSNSPGGGLLEHLDEMKRTGQITKEEFDQTRRAIIEKASRQMKDDELGEKDTLSIEPNDPP
tara:strand:+ start:20582 stop:20944 length:363 start_codon:yes stop_codon:yes gene_type:complete